MARGIGVIEGCYTNENEEAVLLFCVTVMPEEGETFITQTHHLEYIADGSQTQSQLNNGIQAEAIAQMALLGITLTGNKFIQTKFT